MPIEDSLSSIAMSLEKLCSLWERTATVAEANLRRVTLAAVEEPAPAPVAEVPASPEEAAVQEDGPSYEELKAKVIALGREVPKGTKKLTLLKWLSAGETPSPEQAIEGATVTEADLAEAEPEPVAEDPGATADDEAPETMTIDAAKDCMTALGYKGEADQACALRKAIKDAGALSLHSSTEAQLFEIVHAYKKWAEDKAAKNEGHANA